MHERLIDYYNDELHHLRREAAEFAAEFKDAAPLLALDKSRVEDPYVERLLEGVAYLAARTRLKLDAQYPVFTQQLLEVLFPGWLAPTPSACILRLQPTEGDDKLTSGPVVKRGSVVGATLRGMAGVRCEFETTRALQLFPLATGAIQYTAASPERPASAPSGDDADSSLRIELVTTGGASLDQLSGLERLPFYVALPEPHGSQLLELVAGRCVRVGVSSDPSFRRDVRWLPGSSVCHLGLDDDDRLMPRPSRGHVGFRLLREYAALPEKFRFFELTGLSGALRGLKGGRLFVTIHLGGVYRKLESAVRADSLALYCVPAVNLRERELDRIDIVPGQAEYQVVGDRTSVRRYEVVRLLEVWGEGAGVKRGFQPVFEVANAGQLATESFYTLRRERRRFTEAERRERTARLQGSAGHGGSLDFDAISDPARGTDLYISLAERGAGPHGQDLQHISIRALCMEREIPGLLRAQASLARYEFRDSLPVRAIDCVSGPTDPLDYAVEGFDPWRVLSHLQANHLALQDLEPGQAAEALRSMLTLFAPVEAHPLVRQAKSLVSVSTRSVTRRLPARHCLGFARGVQVRLSLSDRGFDGGSPFILGALLDRYLAAHVSMNSFVETSLTVKDWPKDIAWRRSPGERPVF